MPDLIGACVVCGGDPDIRINDFKAEVLYDVCADCWLNEPEGEYGTIGEDIDVESL